MERKVIGEDSINIGKHTINVIIYEDGMQHPADGDMLRALVEVEFPAYRREAYTYPLVEDFCFEDRLSPVSFGYCGENNCGLLRSDFGEYRLLWQPIEHVRVCTFHVYAYSWGNAVKSAKYRVRRALQPLMGAVEKRQRILQEG